MSTREIIFDCDPTPQPRIRRSRHGGVYTPPTADAFKRAALIAWRAKYGSVPPMLGPLELSATFAFARPESHFTKKGVLKAAAPEMPMGDLDNLLKAVEDALQPPLVDRTSGRINGYAYLDDRQVCRYGEVERGWCKGRAKTGWCRVTISETEVREL